MAKKAHEKMFDTSLAIKEMQIAIPPCITTHLQECLKQNAGGHVEKQDHSHIAGEDVKL